MTDRFIAALTLSLSLCLSVADGASAQDAKPPNAKSTSSKKQDEATATKKQPRVKSRPDPSSKAAPHQVSDHEAGAADTKSTKAQLAADGNATDAELEELLQVHGVTCEQCEGDACNGCKMAPLPESLQARPVRDHDLDKMRGHHRKMKRNVENARRAVVRVVNARKRGSGFLFGSKRHVVTALSVVDSGRSTYVVDHNGAEINAKVVGTDRGAGLALLQLDAELSDAKPLRASNKKGKGSHFGHTMVIGNHYGSGQRWGVDLNKLTNGVVQPATISSQDGDALLLGNSFPDTFAGAPVVAPNGQLLGVVRWAKKKKHSSIATSAHRVQGFYNAHTQGYNDEYQGRVRLRWGGGLMLFAGNESTFGGGLQLSTSIDFFDMFGVTVRAAYGLGTQDLADDDFSTPVLSRNYGRWILDGIVYYRFLMPGFAGKRTPISIGVGGAYVTDSGDQRELQGDTFVTNEFSYDRGMLEADLQVGWLRGSFFIRPDETEDWFFTLSASMQY